jgi:hypothetical protein
MGVFPDFDGVGGAGELRSIVGALLMFVLVTAVLMLIVCAVVWADRLRARQLPGRHQGPHRPAGSRSAPPRWPAPEWPGSTSCWASAPACSPHLACAAHAAGVLLPAENPTRHRQGSTCDRHRPQRDRPSRHRATARHRRRRHDHRPDPERPGAHRLGVVWGFGANSSNPHLASSGKVGVLVSCGAAIICGASVTLINFFWNVGQAV